MPRELVKKAVVGTGDAEKAQVHAMVSRLLPGAGIAGPDAADALAVAITHAHHLATASGSNRFHTKAPKNKGSRDARRGGVKSSGQLAAHQISLRAFVPSREKPFPSPRLPRLPSNDRLSTSLDTNG